MSEATTVKVYSTNWCGFCHQAKEYFKSIGVKFADINVEEDQSAAREMVQKTGQMGVPVIEIGDKVIIGYNRPAIDTALKENKLIK